MTAARDRPIYYSVPRHQWQNNVIYEFPLKNNAVLGGWQLNALINLSTGNFLNPLWAGADPTNTGQASFRPDATRPVAYPETETLWYDRGAFPISCGGQIWQCRSKQRCWPRLLHLESGISEDASLRTLRDCATRRVRPESAEPHEPRTAEHDRQ